MIYSNNERRIKNITYSFRKECDFKMAKTISCNTRFGRVVTPPESDIRLILIDMEMNIHKLYSSFMTDKEVLEICNHLVANLECLALEYLLHNRYNPEFEKGYDQVTSLVKEVMQAHGLPGWEGL